MTVMARVTPGTQICNAPRLCYGVRARMFDRGGVSKPSKPPMLAARLSAVDNKRWISDGGRKRREEKNKEIDKNFSATDTRICGYADAW
jgi:hypothetical protein